MANESKVSALVLPVEKVASGEPQVIGGVPGRWLPGQAYLPAALGVTLKQATDLIEQFGWPLEVAKVPESQALATFQREPGSHAPSTGARTVMPYSKEPDVVADEHGVPLMQTPSAAPGDNPPWVDALIRDATARANGEPLPGAAPMTNAIPGIPLPETPDVGLSAATVEDEAAPEQQTVESEAGEAH